MQSIVSSVGFGLLVSMAGGLLTATLADRAKRKPDSWASRLVRKRRVPWRIQAALAGSVAIAAVWWCWLWLPRVWQEFFALPSVLD